MTATISITDKGKTVTYHAHHMRDVIEPVKKSGMFGEQFDVKKKYHRDERAWRNRRELSG